MFDEKKLKQITNRVKQYIQEEIIKTKQSKENVDFFLTNAKNSLSTAQAIYDLSTNTNLQNHTGHKDLNGFLWVINASYYSMFYITRAMLANEGIQLKSDFSIHAITFDSLVHFFYMNNKLEKTLIEAFVNAQEEAAEILGKEKAHTLITGYFYEKKKRANLTYETGELAIKSKAETSLKRAKIFNEELRKVILFNNR